MKVHVPPDAKPSHPAGAAGVGGPPLSDLLDWAKGVAILLVMLVHAARGWFGWQGVHVFIVASGFLLAYGRLRQSHPAPWADWYRRRAERILPAYWIVATAGFLLMLAGALLTATPPGEAFGSAFSLFVRDVTLTRNASFQTMFGPVNAALWYVPLIAGLYLAFPLLYTPVARAQRGSQLALLLLAVVAVEAAYRTVSILLFDGMPVGYGQGALPGVRVPVTPLDRLPAQAAGFQLWAPFGWFPSRVGEFALGMAAAWLLLRHPVAEQRLRHGGTLAAGLAVWVAGNLLVYAGRWGWVLADLLIAAGLTLTLLALASRTKPRSRSLRVFTALGRWAYPLFLVHLLVGYAASQALRIFAIHTPAGYLAVFALVIPAVWATSAALMRLDRSAIPRRMIAMLLHPVGWVAARVRPVSRSVVGG